MNFIYVTHLLIALDLLDELYLCHQVAEQGRALRSIADHCRISRSIAEHCHP